MKKRFTQSFIILLYLISWPCILSGQDLSVVYRKDTVFNNITTLKVRGAYCKVLVTRGQDRSVRLHSLLEADSSERCSLTTEIINRVLVVRVDIPEGKWEKYAGKLVFHVPDSVKIDVENTSGDFVINEVNAKNINVVTKTGNITVNKCDGNVIISTISGEVFTDELTGNINVRSKSSDVNLYRIKGAVSVNTSYGNIHIDDVHGNLKTAGTSGVQKIENVKGDILAKSMSGNVKISKAEGKISVLGASGDVDLFQTTGILEIKTTKGDQTGTRINLTGDSRFISTEGKVRMRFIMPDDALTYQLVSDNAFVFALGKSKKKKLSVGKGSILVEAYSTTGALSFLQ